VLQTVDRTGFARSRPFLRGLANDEGSTPLHKAARYARPELAVWLLEHDADESLDVRTKRGNTPLGLALMFGPCAEVESVLRQCALRRLDLTAHGGSRKMMACAEASEGMPRAEASIVAGLARVSEVL
jgi:hypothetical protein